MELNLSPTAIDVIERKLASGVFRDVSEVVEEALLLLRDAPLPEDDEAWLREAIAEGEASGEPVEVDLEELRARLKAGTSWRP